MSVRKRGSVWYYEFMVEGTRYFSRIPGARNKKEALVAEGCARNQLYQRVYGKPIGDEIFIDYAESVAKPWSRYHLEVFRKYFGQKQLKDFSRILVERFKADRLNTLTRTGGKRAPASVNRELAALARVFTLAVKDRKVTENPCVDVEMLPEDNKRERYLDTDLDELMLSKCTGQRAHLKNLIIFTLNTGARRGEALGLLKDRVDRKRDIVWFKNSHRTGTRTKNRKDRSVPLNDKAKAALAEQFALYPDSPFVFPNPRTGGKLMDIKHSFTRLCEEIGLTDFHWHDLRHSFASRLAEEGASATEIQKLLGHYDIRMSARYIHATDARLKSAVDRLARKGVKVLDFEERKAAVG
jgi:integrase